MILKRIIPDTGSNTDYDTGLSSATKLNQNAADIEAALTDAEMKSDELAQGLADEITARELADTDLDSRMTMNEIEIENIGSAMADGFENESTTRQQADASITAQIATKVTRQPLVSITGTIQATAGGQYAYDPATKKMNVSGSNLMWGIQTTPSNGVIYTFNGTNYVWNSSELIEIGTGGGGEGIKTIVANDLLFFDTFLNLGLYENLGYLRGTYSGRLRAPFFDQRVDTIDKIYIRSIDVSDPNAAIPNFKIYGTAQTIPTVPEASEMTLILGHLSYTIKADDPNNWKVSANTNGGSMIFPSLGDVTKSMTFIIPGTSYPILFNGVSIAAGNTVFAIYTAGVWTIDSTIVEIPVIPNYSDISVKKKIDDETLLILKADGNFTTALPSVLACTQKDLILLTNTTDKSQIGVYQLILRHYPAFANSTLKLIASGISLNTIRVAGSGTWENKYDGFDLGTIAFEKIGATTEPMIYVLSGIDEAITIGRKASETARFKQSIGATDIYLEQTDTSTDYPNIIDITKNGASIFATKPRILAGSLHSVNDHVLIADPTVFNIEDVRTVSVTQIGTITGKNLVLSLTLNKI